jgi:hypothetical protein
MAEDMAATVARLRARVEQANRARDQAAYAREQAQKDLAEADAALKAEFGADSPAQAAKLLEDVNQAIEHETAAVDTALRAVGL